VQLDVAALIAAFTTADPLETEAVAQQEVQHLVNLPGRAAGFAVLSAVFSPPELHEVQLPYMLASCLSSPSTAQGLLLWREVAVLTVAATQVLEAAGWSATAAKEAWQDAAR
jgi:hypothetical protein